MPIISALSRRFQDLLTTDAKPDPPRISTEGSVVSNVLSKTYDEKSNPNQTSCNEELRTEFMLNREKFESSATKDAIPTDDSNENPKTGTKYASTSSTPNQNDNSKRADSKTRFKSKRSKHGTQGGAGVVNYNIVNSNGVKIGPRTSYVCNVHQYTGNNGDTAGSQLERNSMESQSRVMPEEVRLLTALDKEITIPDILLVKTHLGHGWKEIARRLSYSEGQIEQFQENYRVLGIDEVIYQLLLDWKQANTKNAKIGTLVRLLWTCRQYDCAQRLAATYYNKNKT